MIKRKAKAPSATMQFYETESFKLMQAYRDAFVEREKAWNMLRRNGNWPGDRWRSEDATKRLTMARNAILEHVRLFEPKPEVCPTCGACKCCGK